MAAALLVAAIVVVALGTGGGTSSKRLERESYPRPIFALSGRVDGLFPGAVKGLRVGVYNPHPYAIRVTGIWARPLDANPSCLRSLLSVGAYRTSFRLARGARTTRTLKATMSRAAPDACKGASFPLTYGGSADRVR